MSSQSGSGLSAADGAAAQGSPWQHEPAVRAALREHWGLRGGLRPMQARAGSRTWQAGGHVVKLARDEPAHFTARLRASEAAGHAGIATGASVRTRAGELYVALPPGREPWVQMITQAISGVRAYYATMPPVQLLYGDGPGIFSANGADISAIIDWGGVRRGSVADDIGCWTAHGATGQIPLPPTPPPSCRATATATTSPPRTPRRSRCSSACASPHAPATSPTPMP
jgi:hypothetical protein